MRVLAIGSDRNLFDPRSESAKRQIAYGEKFGALDIIVFSRGGSREMCPLSEHVRVYPTASRHRLLYGIDAFRIARRLSRPNVISAQDPFESGLIALIVARLCNVPLHVQIHTDLYHPAFKQHSLMNRLRLFIARIVLPRASRIRVVSNRIKDSLRTTNYVLRTEPTVLPIFVDITRFKNADPGSLTERFQQFTAKLLVVSRLEPEKNVSLALRSFTQAAPKDACLIIVGEGSERVILEKNAPQNVFFEGQKDPAPYYALADLVLVPSKYEGYGLTIIEALAAGKPVLATDVGIAKEAGALTASPETYGTALKEWFHNGPFEGKLLYEPYRSFDEYIERYCADIVACVES